MATYAELVVEKPSLALRPTTPEFEGQEAKTPLSSLYVQSTPESGAENGQIAVSQIQDNGIPDGGYGWVCVACVFLVNAHTWGINAAYGIFLSHYLSHNIYRNASPLDYAFISGLSISMAQLVAPVTTLIIRQYGLHASLWLGIVCQTAALLGASWSTEIWQLLVSQGVCFGFGMGFMFNAIVGIIPQWFNKRRSFASSIGATGSGMGGLIYSLAAEAMIQTIGINWAYRILAIVSCGVCIICALLIKDRNQAVGALYTPFDMQLLKRPGVLLTLGWGFFSIIGYTTLLFSLPDYAITIGLTSQQASIAGAILNLGQSVGRPLIGYFSDAIGRINMCLLCTFACGIFCLGIWIPATTYEVLILFAILGGIVVGTLWTTIAPVMAEVVGLPLLPSGLSIFWVSLIIPSAFAEVVALQLRQVQRPIYRPTQIFTGMMFVAAAVCMWLVRAWKLSERETGAGFGAVMVRNLWLWTKV